MKINKLKSKCKVFLERYFSQNNKHWFYQTLVLYSNLLLYTAASGTNIKRYPLFFSSRLCPIQ